MTDTARDLPGAPLHVSVTMELGQGNPGMKFTWNSGSTQHGCSQALLFMGARKEPLHGAELDCLLYLEDFTVLLFKSTIHRPQWEKNLVFNLLCFGQTLHMTNVNCCIVLQRPSRSFQKFSIS